MSYLVLARKYRPLTFSTVAGQQHVTRTLANAIARGKVAHAYLFAGPRGVGKTSISRIFARALNCTEGPTPEPCGKCLPCLEIAKGNSLAVREIDGASHNSVDNVRELIESFRSLPPAEYRYKIYIIDEVHMLSTSAFNALLKSLEEPPPNTVFILATTELHKIPETVISRCQRYDFKALSSATIQSALEKIVEREGLTAQNEALRLIARVADGSMRDAQSLLDRVQTFCDGNITADEVSVALGTVQKRALFEISGAIVRHDASEGLRQIREVLSGGADPVVVGKEFVAHWRELFTAGFGAEGSLASLGISDEEAVELRRQVGSLTKTDIQDLYRMAREGADSAIRSNFPGYALEALVVRMASREPVLEIGKLIKEIQSGRLGGQASASAPSRTARADAARPKNDFAAPPVVTEVAGGAAASEKTVAAAPVPARTDTPTQSSQALTTANFDWSEFIRTIGTSVLSEHLKRIRIVRFDSTRLEGTAPEFSVTSILRDRAKLEKALLDFCTRLGFADAKPVLAITVSSEKTAVVQPRTPGSPSSGHGVAASFGEVESHPAVQSLQKAFPGSKIEKVRPRSAG